MPWESPAYGNVFYALIIAMGAVIVFWGATQISAIRRFRRVSILRQLEVERVSEINPDAVIVSSSEDENVLVNSSKQ
jgi:hypothetical protein